MNNVWTKQLKQFLDKNNISSGTTNMKQIQEAVYKAKCNGEDLGYTFGKYALGMFSPELRNDVERLNWDYCYDPA